MSNSEYYKEFIPIKKNCFTNANVVTINNDFFNITNKNDFCHIFRTYICITNFKIK